MKIVKFRGDELADEDKEDLDLLISPSQVSGLDDGIEYEVENDGTKANKNKGYRDSLLQLIKGVIPFMVCRSCGEKNYHWTFKCLYKDLAVHNGRFIDKSTGHEAVASSKGSRDSGASMGKGVKAFMVCWSCGKNNDQWTSTCRYKDLAVHNERFNDKPNGPEAAGSCKGSRDSAAQLEKGGLFPLGFWSCDRKNDQYKSKYPYRDLALPNERFIDKPIGPETAASGTGSGDSLAQLGNGGLFPIDFRSFSRRNGHFTSKCLHRDLAVHNERFIDKPTRPKAAGSSKGSRDSMAQLGKGGVFPVVCWSCGRKNDHYTTKCPYKDTAVPYARFINNPIGFEAAAGSKDYVGSLEQL